MKIAKQIRREYFVKATQPQIREFLTARGIATSKTVVCGFAPMLCAKKIYGRNA